MHGKICRVPVAAAWEATIRVEPNLDQYRPRSPRSWTTPENARENESDSAGRSTTSSSSAGGLRRTARVYRSDVEFERVQPTLADPLGQRDPDGPPEPVRGHLQMEVDVVLADAGERFGGHRGSPKRPARRAPVRRGRRAPSGDTVFPAAAAPIREPLNSRDFSFGRLTAKAVGKHPVSFRTRKLSPLAFRAVPKCASLREPRKAVSLRNLPADRLAGEMLSLDPGSAPPVRLGAHIGIAEGLGDAPRQGRAIGCDAIQIFSKSPKMWACPPISDESAAAFRAGVAAVGLKATAVHHGYLVNLASPKKAMLGGIAEGAPR